MAIAQQDDLFAHARAFDPETSHLAATSTPASVRNTHVDDAYRIIQAAEGHGATCDEVFEQFTVRHPEVRFGSLSRRLTDLHQTGRIHADGHRPGQSGRLQIVWTAS